MSKVINLNIVPKTIFITIGPSGCGKSTFVDQIYAQIVGDWKTFVLSSDNIRKHVNGNWNLDPVRDVEMMYASEAAFELLFKELEIQTKFPQNADFILVDTTGLSEDFRNKVIEVAQKTGYNVDLLVFNYKDTQDYYKYSNNRKLTSDMVLRMRRDVLKSLAKGNKYYRKVFKIAQHSSPHVVVESPFPYNFRNETLNAFIMSDVHGCYVEMKELLNKKGFSIGEDLVVVPPEPQSHLVFLGDLIDKGPYSKKMIEFAYANRTNKNVYFVACNHGNFVYKYMQGMLKDVAPEALKYFDTIDLLKEDEDLLFKFNEYWKHTIPYYRNKKVIVTHAPCKNEFLEKDSESARKAMRNLRYPTRGDLSWDEYQDLVLENISFIYEEAVRNHPFHVFGHISLKEPLWHKNKIGIDTGCYAGGRLTMVEIPSYESKPFFHSVESKQIPLEETLVEIANKEKEIDPRTMETRDFRRIKWMAHNKVNFISGTVAPADKKLREDGTWELESLDAALEHFRSQGITHLTVQPKYMGSRANIYLYFKDGQLDDVRCLGISRNGFKINIDLSDIYKNIEPKVVEYIRDFLLEDPVRENISLVILDGELLPWKAMGTGLIDRSFLPVRDGARSEIDLLEKTGFEQELERLIEKREATDFDKDFDTFSKKDLIDKYSMNNYQNFSNSKFTWYPLKTLRELVDTYSEQLDIFTADQELEFVPFSLLKVEFNDGREPLVCAEDTTYSVDKSYFVVSEKDDAGLKEYWKELTENQKMEGVVVKPTINNTKKKILGIKVRNPRYLSLVYGYDYTLEEKYEKLIKQKRIGKKVKVSNAEYDLGLKMLSIPNDQIAMENKGWFNLAARLILEEKKEKEIDPRL